MFSVCARLMEMLAPPTWAATGVARAERDPRMPPPRKKGRPGGLSRPPRDCDASSSPSRGVLGADSSAPWRRLEGAAAIRRPGRRWRRSATRTARPPLLPGTSLPRPGLTVARFMGRKVPFGTVSRSHFALLSSMSVSLHRGEVDKQERFSRLSPRIWNECTQNAGESRGRGCGRRIQEPDAAENLLPAACCPLSGPA